MHTGVPAELGCLVTTNSWLGEQSMASTLSHGCDSIPG